MGRIPSDYVPIFTGVLRTFPGTSLVNKTVFLVTDDEMVEGILTMIDDVCGSLDEAGTGLMLVFPVDAARGLGLGL